MLRFVSKSIAHSFKFIQQPSRIWTRPLIAFGNRQFCDRKDSTEFFSKQDDQEVYHDWEEPDIPQIGVDKTSSIETPISLKHGVTGVFDPEELITHLRYLNGADLFCARIPKELRYTDYIILVSCRSKRHLRSVAESVRKLFKVKRFESDAIPKIEGLDQESDWLALDLGNIVLHLFLPATRSRYDLESLWACGSNFDDLTQGLTQKNLSTSQIDWDAIAAEVAETRRRTQVQISQHREIIVEKERITKELDDSVPHSARR